MTARRRHGPKTPPEIGPPKSVAAGLPAVGAGLARSYEEMGAVTAARSLLKLNHDDGFDCPGCAWPDPPSGGRSLAEFCENGAKHVAAEATRRHLSGEFFAEHSLSELRGRSDWWLEDQGRLVEPLVKHAGSDHYLPVTWDEALELAAAELSGLASPDEAIFYTSGRASNEAAFTYQLFARAFGTNNLPDCSNMCHESSGAALGETIGIGKGSVTLEDLETAELIVICGQNPGTNHPRMLTHLEVAKKNGARVVAVNPLREAGLLRFKNPQRPSGLLGRGTVLADDYLQVRLAGDQALFRGVAKLLLEKEETAPGSVLDRDFIDRHTAGFEEYKAAVGQSSWEELEEASGLSRREIGRLAEAFSSSQKTIICWAMGLTQHKNSVRSIKELLNVLLLQGNIGKPGAGVFPVRGHSNVQGDRTMGIFEKMPDSFLDALGAEFCFSPPRRHGLDAVGAIGAIRDAKAKALVCLGGNLVRAISDSEVARHAMSKLRLSVSVATKLNASHVWTGEVAVIFPCLGRSERDLQDGVARQVTVEDSVGSVHASVGRLRPASRELRSEVAIICELAARTLARRPGAPGATAPIDWAEMGRDYALIRQHVSRVVPGFEAYNEKVAEPGGFLLPHPPRDSRTFTTQSGRAHFTAEEIEFPRLPPDCLLLQTVRSHDQFNTTIYGYDDRYRGLHGTREVVFVNREDLARLGLKDGQLVDLETVWHDGVKRRVRAYRAVSYPTAKGCVAGYFPELNVLVPLDSVADGSNTPTSKSVVVRLLPHEPDQVLRSGNAGSS
jgi:molybdopterin-dependent oxidoreductase alpha subunit